MSTRGAELAFTPVIRADYEALVDLMVEAWYDEEGGRPSDEARAFAANELLAYLVENTFSCAARLDGEIIGFTLARHGDGFDEARATWGPLLESVEERFPRTEGSPAYTSEITAKVEMLDAMGMPDDDCVLLLVVGSAARGMGLGRTLLERDAEYLSGEGADTLHLVTDTSCDYRFYDHLGLKRLGALPGADEAHTPDEYFLYGTRLRLPAPASAE